MEEILQQILNRLDSLESLKEDIADLKKGQASLQQQVTDLRDSTFNEFQSIHKELGAFKETQLIAMDKWRQSINILERVETMLDDREAAQVATDAAIIGHEGRITALEQKAG